MHIHSEATESGFQALPGDTCPRDFSLMAKVFPNLSVLVVDDESLIRWSLAQTLMEQGHVVREAADGRGAMEVLQQSMVPFDVIMLDYRLPDTTALQLLGPIPRPVARKPRRADDRLRDAGNLCRGASARRGLRRPQAGRHARRRRPRGARLRLELAFSLTAPRLPLIALTSPAVVLPLGLPFQERTLEAGGFAGVPPGWGIVPTIHRGRCRRTAESSGNWQHCRWHVGCP